MTNYIEKKNKNNWYPYSDVYNFKTMVRWD